MTGISIDRLVQRVAALYANDPQFAAAQPSEAVSAAIADPALRLPEIIETIMVGYAERPALGQRAVELVTDPRTGRTSTELLPRFQTITYAQLWEQACALGTAFAADGVRPGDRVCVLGFASVDYTVVDLALVRVGAVSVPLQTNAPVDQLRSITAETEPVMITTSIEHLDDAVELALTGHTPERVVVFNYRPEVDDHREAMDAARNRLAQNKGAVVLESLPEALARGADLPTAPAFISEDGDASVLLLYTSGSTGTPKGAMRGQQLLAEGWRRAVQATFGEQGSCPLIVLSFMPMSHMMGRIFYAALSIGGTGYFAAKSDLSTLMEDLALVRPTQLSLVPRVWEMLYEEFGSRVDRITAEQPERSVEAISDQVLAELRQDLLGGRVVAAMSNSAPTSPQLRDFVERLLELPLMEGYGATETGSVLIDGLIQRPPVTDYKLVDVPELGYFLTDQPYPRGELLLKSVDLFPGYYRRPDVTAEVFDEDGFYRTGDVFAELEPDRLTYLDRRNSVQKLAQGEFVTISRLEAVFSSAALVRQIYVYGDSERAYLLAVVVPTDEAVAAHTETALLKSAVLQSMQQAAKTAGLQPYEIPRDILLEHEPFSPENGLLTGIRKLARPQLKTRYGPHLQALYAELDDQQNAELHALRQHSGTRPIAETLRRAAGAILGTTTQEIPPDTGFTDLGGDSLSAVRLATLLSDIFGIDVPVALIVSPTTDLAALADYIHTQRAGTASGPTVATVHGHHPEQVRAAELTLDKFLDPDLLAAAPKLPRANPDTSTVLLTGATGFLGRYLALEWLERMHQVGGTLICPVRAANGADARARLDAAFNTGDPALWTRYTTLAKHLRVIAADKTQPRLGLDTDDWQDLADTVDLIVDAAAMVNHVLPYSELFGPNVTGTAELIRLALTNRIKPIAHTSTIAVGTQIPPHAFTETADIRTISPTRRLDDTYANGYATSKWASEVLLRYAHDLCALPTSIYRCSMILAEPRYRGQLNTTDMFTRLMLTLATTGIAPPSFYRLDSHGNRQPAHYDALPVDFVAGSITTLSQEHTNGFDTYHVVNPHHDNINLDTYVDWLIESDHPIHRLADYPTWLNRTTTILQSLPEHQRQHSLLPLIHNHQDPLPPTQPAITNPHFRDAVQHHEIAPDIPHITPEHITKYITDLRQLDLL